LPIIPYKLYYTLVINAFKGGNAITNNVIFSIKYRRFLYLISLYFIQKYKCRYKVVITTLSAFCNSNAPLKYNYIDRNENEIDQEM